MTDPAMRILARTVISTFGPHPTPAGVDAPSATPTGPHRELHVPNADARQCAFEAATEFVAQQPDGPARVLVRHYRRPNGLCSGCTATPTRWPCTAAAIAVAGRRLG